MLGVQECSILTYDQPWPTLKMLETQMPLKTDN